MTEKHIVLEDIDPVIFYGVNNTNMQMIKALYPKLRIVARGNVIKVMGDEEEMCAFEESIIALEKHCAKYNSLKEEIILDIVKGKTPQIEKTGDTIVFSVTGKPIVPRSENQLKLVKEYEKNDMIWVINGIPIYAQIFAVGVDYAGKIRVFSLGIKRTVEFKIRHAHRGVQFPRVGMNVPQQAQWFLAEIIA